MISDCWLVWLGLLLTVAACARTDQPNAAPGIDDPPQFKIETRRADDHSEVQLRPGQVVLLFRSPTGISEAKITRVVDVWPETLIVRLHLTGLEHFSLTQGEVKLEGAISSQDGTLRLWRAGQEDQPLQADDPLWINVRRLDAAGQPTAALPCPDGSIELELPPAFLKGNPAAFTLSWIDFYRN